MSVISCRLKFEGIPSRLYRRRSNPFKSLTDSRVAVQVRVDVPDEHHEDEDANGAKSSSDERLSTLHKQMMSDVLSCVFSAPNHHHCFTLFQRFRCWGLGVALGGLACWLDTFVVLTFYEVSKT